MARVSDHLSQIHLFGNVTSKNRRTCEPQCGRAPSCWKIIQGRNSSEVQRKVPTYPRSYLSINVCDQEKKTLCSPCRNQSTRFPDLHMGTLLEAGRNFATISEPNLHKVTRGGQAGIRPPKTLEPDWLQHDGTAACVIAQQYSSAT